MPTFIGQVATELPRHGVRADAAAVLIEFNALHGGVLNLAPLSGRGFTGSFDVQVTTNANGTFTVPAPFLPEGFQNVRLVVSRPAGRASRRRRASLRFSTTSLPDRQHRSHGRKSAPDLTPGAVNLPLGTTSTPLNSLTTLSLDVVDPASPATGPLATPAAVLYPAANPLTASNISNYSLINLDQPNSPDFSRFITSATFVATGADFQSAPNRLLPSTPYFGRIDLTFAPGLVAGHYQFIVHTAETVNGVTYTGLTDAAGNPLDDSTVSGQASKDFVLNLNIQPQPVYITSVSTDVTNAQGNTLLPYSYYEINPRAGDIVSAPPTTFYVDFSNPLDPTEDFSNTLQLIRSADSPTSAADGDFGNLGEAGLGSTGTGFTRVDPSGTTVTLTAGPNGVNTRLVLSLPVGFVLPADHYRFYMPNNTSTGTAVNDIYGNQLDGEFLGDQAQSGTDAIGNPDYEDLLPNGQYRIGMSGDSVAGGGVHHRGIQSGSDPATSSYARPDYVENPLLPSTASNGTVAQPYSVLAPQAAPDALNASTLNNGDPNGGLNSAVNF